MSNQKKEKVTYWFPAKRYGWGWGMPLVWQGWVTLILYLGLVALSFFIFPPHQNPGVFIIAAALLSVFFIVVCWVKGEPPKWRWGSR